MDRDPALLRAAVVRASIEAMTGFWLLVECEVVLEKKNRKKKREKKGFHFASRFHSLQPTNCSQKYLTR